MIVFFRMVNNGKVIRVQPKEYDTPPVPNDHRLMSDIYSCEDWGDLDPLRMARIHGRAPWVEAIEVEPHWVEDQGS